MHAVSSVVLYDRPAVGVHCVPIMTLNTAVMFGRASDEWSTPQDFFDTLNAEFEFQIDAAATSTNAKCQSYFTVRENALERDWFNYSCDCLHSLQGRISGDARILLAAAAEAQRPQFHLQGLSAAFVENSTGAAAPERTGKGQSGEAAVYADRPRPRMEAAGFFDLEPQASRARTAVSMDARGLAALPDVLASPVRVLRRCASRAGSCNSPVEREVSGNGAVEYGAGLHEVQPFTNQGQDRFCPSCGIPGRPATAFLNCPYSRCREFIAKAAEEAQKGCTVVCLVPARVDTRWFHDHVYDRATNGWRPGVEVRFLKGRLKFGEGKNSAPFPSMLVIFRPADSLKGI